MGDFGWIGQAVSGIGEIYGAAKQGQIQTDTLNKESAMQDAAFAQKAYLMKQQKSIVIIVSVALVAIVVIQRLLFK